MNDRSSDTQRRSATIVKRSRYSYPATLSRLLQAIAHAGSTVFTMIDQSAAAQRVGLALRPTSLIVFGNPKAGTRLMEAFPLVALDLPLKILVWQEDDGVNVAFNSPLEILRRYQTSGQDELIAALDAALHALIDAVAQPEKRD